MSQTQPDNLLLLLEAYSDAVRTIRVKGLTQSGAVIDLKLETTGDSELTSNTVAFPLDTLSISVIVDGTGIKRGNIYASLTVVEKGENRTDLIDVLTTGYVYDGRPLKWHWLSGGIIEGPGDGKGLTKFVIGTDPDAVATGNSGGDASETVPAQEKWELNAVKIVLTTSSTSNNREMMLIIKSSLGATFMEFPASTGDQTANTTITYYWIDGNPSLLSIFSSRSVLPLPRNLNLVEGEEIATNIIGKRMGDNITSVRYHIEKWIDPQ